MISETDRKEIAVRVYDPDSRRRETESDPGQTPTHGRPLRPTPLGLRIRIPGLHALTIYTAAEWAALPMEKRTDEFHFHEGLWIRLKSVSPQ